MNYQWVPLGDLLSRRKDEIEVQEHETYKRLTIRMHGMGIQIRDKAAGSEIGTKRQFIVRSKQFLLSKIDARNGAFGIVPEDCDGAIITGNFWAFDVDHDRLDGRFFEYLTRTPTFVDFCVRASEGTTNRHYLQEPAFLAQTMMLPPFPEQRRIVARIETLAAKIAEARGLRSQLSSEVGLLVDSAAAVLLGQIDLPTTELRNWLDPDRDGIQTGPFGAQLSSQDFTDFGIPVLTIGNVQYGGLNLKSLKYVDQAKAATLGRFVTHEGDLLFARMGTVGRCCIVPTEAAGWLINYHIIRVAVDRNRIDPRFVLWTIRASTDVKNYLGDKIRGATREGVNSSIVGSLPCRVPDLTEQGRIVAYLDAVQAKVDGLQREQDEVASELDALLPAILDRAFRGEL